MACYKISNIADRNSVEEEFGIPFRYPSLYKIQQVIDGLEESTVPIIASQFPNTISLGIWGILPKAFKEDWKVFQNVENTLNVELDKVNEASNYYEALQRRRCIVVTTGFFTYHLRQGELYPYYVHLESNKPFGLAGIYNVLDDGFMTFSLLTSNTKHIPKHIQNSNSSLPIMIPKKNYGTWLNEKSSLEVVRQLLNRNNAPAFIAHPIAKEFTNLGIIYESILEPVNYKGIPTVNL